MGGLELDVGTTCSLLYGPDFGSEVDLRLMEVDESLLKEVVLGGVCLKGCGDDEAVLCTSEKTFAVKYVGTSNTVLLIPPPGYCQVAKSVNADGGGEGGSTDREAMRTESINDMGNGEGADTTEQQISIGKNDRKKIEVLATASGHLEISPVPPRLERLKELLGECVLDQNALYEEEKQEEGKDAGVDGRDVMNDHRGGEIGRSMRHRPSHRKRGYTLDELLEMVQASEKEVRDALRVLRALEVNGRWRLVDEKFLAGVLDILLLTIIEKDWDMRSLRESVVVEGLKHDGCASYIVRHCLSVYGSRVTKDLRQRESDGERSKEGAAEKGGEAMDIDVGRRSVFETEKNGEGVGSGEGGGDVEDDDLWCLDGGKLCVHRARQLLAGVAKWRLDDFMESWEQNVPQGESMTVKPNVEMLKGEVLVESVGGEVWVREFRARDLPSAPAARFGILFGERAKWLWEDLEPFLKDLEAPGQTIDSLLLKYTRKSQSSSDSPAVFTAR